MTVTSFNVLCSIPRCYLNYKSFAADLDIHTDDSDIRLNIFQEVENLK